jgi:PAS domain S-box-containing protein
MPFSTVDSSRPLDIMKQVFDQSFASIYIIDQQRMKFIDANQSALQSIGYTKEELLQIGLQDIDAVFTQEIMATAFESIRKSEEKQATIPTIHKRKDKSTFEVEVYLKAVEEGGKNYILASATRSSVIKKAAQEMKFHSILLNHITDAIISLDKDLRISSLNKYAAALFGWEEKEVTGIYFRDLLRPVYPEVSEEEQRLRYYEEGEWRGKVIFSTKEGRRFPANVSYGLVKDEEGTITGTVAVIRDKTELYNLNRKLEQTVQEKTQQLTHVSERYLGLMETAHEGVWHIDENSQTTFVNSYLATLLGYTPEEMIGKDALDFIPAEHKAKALQNIADRKAGISRQHELSFHNRRGEVIHTLIQSAPIYKEGEYAGSISMLLDITQRKTAEEELRLSEQKYRIVFENNPLPMFMLEYPKRNFVAVNHALVEKFGYSREEFEKMDIVQLRRLDEKHKSDEVAKALAEKHQLREQMYLRKKDGTSLLFDVQISRIFFEGKIVYLASTRDLTEQVMAEETLLQKNKQLKELTEHLQNVREEERKHMSREIHDELGQQLTALKMDLSWVAKKLIGQEEAVITKVKSLLDLVDGTIQGVRRIATELRPSLLDDLGLAEAIKWQTIEFAKRTGIETGFKSNVEELVFPPDISISLFRILQESLTNIARHAEARKVDCTLNSSGHFLLLEVRDDGVGFIPNQPREARSLGLLGIRERVDMLKGEYDLLSEPGKGTRLTVKVPLVVN